MKPNIPLFVRSTTHIDPLRHRKWININPLTRFENRFDIKVSSYNMLNQAYMWPQIYNTYVPSRFRSWDYRFHLLMRIIEDEEIRSDIMCFQEMDTRTYKNHWKPLMKEKYNYNAEYIKKSMPLYWNNAAREKKGKLKDDMIDGVSCFYNTEKFDLVEVKKFNISKYFQDEFSQKSKYNTSEIEKVFKSRNQVCLIVVLKHKISGKLIMCINTHLYWKYSEIQLLQMIMILDALNILKNKYDNQIRILLTGDFNSKPNSSVYKLLKEQHISVEEEPSIKKYVNSTIIENPIHTNKNIFDYPELNDLEKCETEPMTCYTHNLYGIFDYIWFDEKDFQVRNVLSGIDKEYLLNIQGLPNREFPSDHIPIVAEFSFT